MDSWKRYDLMREYRVRSRLRNVPRFERQRIRECHTVGLGRRSSNRGGLCGRERNRRLPVRASFVLWVEREPEAVILRAFPANKPSLTMSS